MMDDQEFAAAKFAYERQQADRKYGIPTACSPLAARYLPELERRARGGVIPPTPEGPDFFDIGFRAVMDAPRPRRRWWRRRS